MEQHTFVDCNHCANWDDSRRRGQVCKACNNTQKVIDPKEILCNRCAGPMRPLGTFNEQYEHGLENSAITGGYDSYHLFDMTTYTFSLCEKCLRELFNEFKIPPLVSDRLDMDINAAPKTREEYWKEDQEAYEYRVWVDEGKHHQAYLDRKCNRVKNCPNEAIYTRLYRNEFTEDSSCEEHKDRYFQGNVHKLVKFIPNVLKPFL